VFVKPSANATEDILAKLLTKCSTCQRSDVPDGSQSGSFCIASKGVGFLHERHHKVESMPAARLKGL
jgi:hypothetical protein